MRSGKVLSVGLLLLVFTIASGLTAYAEMIDVDATSVDRAADGRCSLMEAIENANQDIQVSNDDCPAGDAADVDKIILTANSTYTLRRPDNNTNGANGLPVITGEISIEGNNAIIERDPSLSCTLDGAQTADEFRILYADNNAKLQLSELTIRNGCADGEGETSATFAGGLWISGTAEITDSTIVRNRATNDAGGIAIIQGDLELINSSILNNEATDAVGGIGAQASTVMIRDCTISGNSADRDVGGIFNRDGSMEIIGSEITDNRAASDSGGIDQLNGTLAIRNSTISNNQAHRGGGIFLEGSGEVEIINSTISHNKSAAESGGIGMAAGIEGMVSILHSTVAQNSASRGAGLSVGANMRIRNSIVANNSGGDCVFEDDGHLDASSQNLDSDGTCAAQHQAFSTEIPFLGPLADNGGPTNTHALMSGSPAIDAVSDCTGFDNEAVEQDQRGVSRPQDGDDDGRAACDLGAYEKGDSSTARETRWSSVVGFKLLLVSIVLLL